MIRKMITRALFFILIAFSITASAQPMLPDMAAASEKGINVLSWMSQFDGVKSIAVQRSSDSAHNYTTVGFVKNIKKGRQAFIDGHPLPGNNWYQLYIVFSSDLTWFSNRVKLVVDSNTIANKGVLPPNDSLQKLASKIKIDTAAGGVVSGNPADTLQGLIDKLVIAIPDPGEINAYSYVKSQYVFTNPFTGHVNMELPEVKDYRYSIRFYDDKDKRVMEIPRVAESPIIIDKRNFKKKGLYKFDLIRDNEKMETGYITIY
ncbi:MAG: hypothetical protein EOP56_09805 [Sphingobacteriales bacterium]|nr:MAG: hypothetical protein EOP56_09805 [Sphingobacteriales bacterium]